MYANYVKRILDLTLSLIAVILCSPIFLILFLLVRFKLGSPVLFTQERPGKDEKIFRLYKFRTMTSQTDAQGELLPDEIRLTSFGKKLRATSLDELPELFNILKGDMSLVGPRPEVPYHVEHFKEEIPRYLVRQQVRPGCTGWAQIHGLRGDTDIAERIRYDIWYIENWTVALDIKIIFRTVFGGKMVNDEKLQ